MVHFQYRKARALMFASLLVLGLALSCGTAATPTPAPVATSTPLPSPGLAPGQAPASPTPTPLPVAAPTQGPKVSSRTVVDRLKVRPQECVVFEDSLLGEEAARRAGMAVVAITTSHRAHEFHHARIKVLDFSNLTPARAAALLC